MDAPNNGFMLVGSLEELRAKGPLVVQGGHGPILIVYDRGRVFALDNRCPHMGFPLERGTVEDGILTCHWHHARFDLQSGCKFDLWADDVPSCAVEVRNGDVWVATTSGHSDPAAHWRQRLMDGLAHDLGLVIAKGVHGELAAGVPVTAIVRQVALFGAQNRDGWGVGLTILTALANLLPVLQEDDTYLALFHGARRVAADCAGEAPRRERAPLDSRPEPAALKRWLRLWTNVRHREAAERTLLTAIATGVSPAVLSDALLSAGTERAFADTGHSLDFINKAFECLDLVGWEHASVLLPTIVAQMVAARGAEESTAWRQPVDLVALCDESASQMRQLFSGGRCSHGWSEHAALARELLGDDPAKIIDALKAAIRAGAAPADLGQSLAYGAARRCASRASAMPTSTPTGRRRTTFSPMPTRSNRCSGGSGTRASTATSRPCAPSRTGPWRFTLSVILTCHRPASRVKVTISSTTSPPMRRRSAPRCSMPSTGSDRSILRQGWWHAILRSAIRPRR
ncbi:Rieske 2Fe-2S domain-containing protein [Paraburkholderia hospita]|uniref:Rieske (2Fe-2S) protein n=1 Tax=Paraburkholderia hospita TaxID=169430 RepID=UPI003ECE9A5A